MSDKTQTLEHRVHFRPAYDKRDPDPRKNYGLHNMRIAFYVIGPAGAVEWAIGTGWYVRSAREHLRGFPDSERGRMRPSGWNLGIHSRTPIYDGQTAVDNCQLLGGAPCYCDGSGLNAEHPIEGFLDGGEEWLWAKLEAYYRYVFEGDSEYPFNAEAAACEAAA